MNTINERIEVTYSRYQDVKDVKTLIECIEDLVNSANYIKGLAEGTISEFEDFLLDIDPSYKETIEQWRSELDNM